MLLNSCFVLQGDINDLVLFIKTTLEDISISPEALQF